MSQAVTYADLRFVPGPPETKRSPPTEPEDEGDAELTYENVRGGPPPRQGQEEEEAAAAAAVWGASRCAAGPGRRSRFTVSALLGACLFLLGTTVGLGVRYWQVSRQLQQASHGHSAERDALAERISTKERQLDEAKAELSSTRLTLQDWETAGSPMQEQLQKMERELREAKEGLALLQEEKRQEQQAREEKEAELSNVRRQLEEALACLRMGCCPSGWLFFQWKCLWVSSYLRSWTVSQKVCEEKASQLLVLKNPQDAERLWEAEPSLGLGSFWIGLRKTHNSWDWFDDSDLLWTQNPNKCTNHRDGSCGQMHQGTLEGCSCSVSQKFICEKAAEVTEQFQTHLRD